MSRIKVKIEIHATVDTDNYPLPADINLRASLKEDLREAIEGSIALELNHIKITGTGNRVNAEVRDTD